MRFPVLNQLSCENHPLFKGLLPLPNDTEPFFSKVLAIEGNIFEECTMTWLPLKKLILRGLWNAASVLEEQVAL